MRGSLFYDPVITYGAVQDDIPSAQMVNYWKPMFSLNDSYLEDLNERADKCGYTDFINTAMTFPPSGPLPSPPDDSAKGCGIWNDVISAAMEVNPCWQVSLGSTHLSDMLCHV